MYPSPVALPADLTMRHRVCGRSRVRNTVPVRATTALNNARNGNAAAVTNQHPFIPRPRRLLLDPPLLTPFLSLRYLNPSPSIPMPTSLSAPIIQSRRLTGLCLYFLSRRPSRR